MMFSVVYSISVAHALTFIEQVYYIRNEMHVENVRRSQTSRKGDSKA